MADFAAAQQRILARRTAREATARSEAQQREASRAAIVDLLRLPPGLRVLAEQSLRAWETVSSPYGTRPAFRVGQVDAELLDEELLELLKSQAGEGLKLYGAHLKDEWGAEIGAALRAALWKLSIWDHGASYGASLQGLKYIDARSDTRRDATVWQRAAYGILMVGGRYAWMRWEDYLANLENGYDEPSPMMRRLSRLTNLFDTTHNVAAFTSFLVFLYDGRYRTLTDRLLRLRLVPSSNQTNREVSFEYLNRQLVWHAFTEFLLFLLPLVGISRWKRWLARAWKKAKATVTGLRYGKVAANAEEEDIQKGELAFLPERTCAICYQDQNPAGGAQSEQDLIASQAAGGGGVVGSAMTDITNPYETMPCGCIYCFVCLAQRIEAEGGEGWTCLRCGDVVKECRPWDGDVLVERKARLSGSSAVVSEGRPASRKSVVFAEDLAGDRDRGGDAEEWEEPMSQLDPMPVDDSDEGFGEGEGGEGELDPKLGGGNWHWARNEDDTT